MGDEHLPKGLRRRDDRASITEDVRPYRDATPAELSRTLSELCRWAVQMLDAHPERERMLADQDPLSPETRALWRRLVARHRAAR